jgi:ABC transport system ATP-binding/permease protein
MPPPLLQLSDIHLTFGGNPLLDGVELSVSAGERVCLVGRNGSGKSTLLRIAAGLVQPDGGERFVQPGAVVRYLPQEPDLSAFDTTLDYVESGLGPAGDPHQARYLLEQLGLTGEESPVSLSGGEARRAALAHVLAPDPEILLLDEPTNHLDLPAIEWLEARLAQQKAALVLISHDRRFLVNLSRVTVWLDRGRTHRAESGFAGFEAWRDRLLEEEENAQHKLDRKIAREEHWMRYGVTARRKRNVRRVAELAALRRARREHRKSAGKAEMAAGAADTSGALVIEARGLAKSFGERTIVKDLSVRIMRGDRVGIVGPNGSGKTTLVNLLSGALAPDRGTVRLGANLAVASLDQRRESLDPAWTLSEALTGGRGDTVSVGGQTKHVVGYMQDFLFSPQQARTPLSALSGGERGRLMLARALAKPSNLLVLDEPTNDLDLETLDVLEELIGTYAGTVILISHDRDFLDRVVNAVLAPEGDGRWIEYAGGYSDMLAQRGADLAGRRPRRARPAPAARAAGAPPAPAAPPTPAKRKLSFNEKHALETLPKAIDALGARIHALQARLHDPSFYARDPTAFAETTADLAAAQSQLAAAEERWLELELLREEIGGG